MIDNLTIVRAVYSGLSQRQVAATHHVYRNTVSLLLRHARAQGWLTLEDLSELDNTMASTNISLIVLSREISIQLGKDT